jgi:DNA mismatch repair protein MutL
VAGGAPGTIVEVRGLFSNVPARKKFLKVPATEFRHIAQTITQMALMNPHVSWTLTHNGKDAMRLPAANDWKNRVAAVLGKEISADMLELNHRRAALVLTGFLSHPAKAKSGRSEQYVFVNRRPVQDFVLAKAVKQGYSHHMEPNRFPAFVLHVSLPADLVDVNVHPRKSEVKFADPSGVFREVVHAVHEALEAVSHTVVDVRQSVIPTAVEGSHPSPFTPSGQREGFDRPTPMQIRQHWQFQQSIAQAATSDTLAVPMPEPALGDWKLLGQLKRCFLLVETEEALLVIDQHAAAEKILYEKILAHAGEGKVQRLLIPLVVEMTAAQFALAMEQQELLGKLGIDIEEFGERTVRLSGVPQDLDVRDSKDFLFGILQDMRDEAFDALPSLDERQQRLAKYAACRGAVKFNDPLTRPEQLQLLVDMRHYHVTACCHGRPVMKKLTVEQLRKEFHRP